MTCRFEYDDKGNVIKISCGRGSSASCKSCGARASKQCDFPLRGKAAGRTCDAHLCAKCATSVGKDRDYCPPHARAEQRRSFVYGNTAAANPAITRDLVDRVADGEVSKP